MPHRDIPFSALRALEAAARHQNFTWAARELQVTHSAISQAVRRIEADVGLQLFQRRGGAMHPSAAALKLAESYSTAAQQLSELMREISGGDAAPALSLRVPSELAALWMPDRAADLAASLPDVAVTILSRRAEGPADVELLVTRAPRTSDQVLCDLNYAPVCTRDMAQARSLTTAAAITDERLVADRPDAWSAWFRQHLGAERRQTVTVSGPQEVLEAARNGDGVGLAWTGLVGSEPGPGGLVALPFSVAIGLKLVLRVNGGRRNEVALDGLFQWFQRQLA